MAVDESKGKTLQHRLLLPVKLFSLSLIMYPDMPLPRIFLATEDGGADASKKVSWPNSSGLERIRELLNNKPPHVSNFEPGSHIIDVKLISTFYSGTTSSVIESDERVTCHGGESSDGSYTSRARAHLPGKELMGKMESRCTFKMTCRKGHTEDGYKWRKYGQKSIKNSPNPRSYYRCTNPRCNAKKQVERSTEDPELLIVTYEGLHLHYTYSQFLAPEPQGFSTAGNHATKKPKSSSVSQQDDLPDNVILEDLTKSPSTMMPQQEDSCHGARTPQNRHVRHQSHGTAEDSSQHRFLHSALQGSQGLLEDIVPLLVRKPCNNSMTFSYGHSPSSQGTSSAYSTFSLSQVGTEILSRTM